ncbi:MAG: hypothetical protein J6S04_07385 [Clostridia bacterium]|nr:hypothetical protein [Clostridia bacterium]
MRKVIAACVSAATVLLVTLLSYLIYQWVTMAILDKRIEKLETEIAQLEQVIAKGEMDLEYYSSEFYLREKSLELQMLLEKK